LLEEEVPPRLKEQLQLVDAASKTMVSLISEILDFSKIEAGKLQLESLPFDLGGLLREVSALASINAHERRLNFRTEISHETPDYVRGDPVRVKQILTNLLNNAAKFTQRGEILLRVRPAAPFDPEKDNVCKLEMSVSDTGIGIPRDQLGSIFEKFTQAESSTARRFGGTGLGLAICKQLAALMQGEIVVESDVGRGSTFTFRVSLPTANFEVREAPVERKRTRIGSHVLVVEDNATNQKVAVKLLEALGCTSDIADNGISALSMIERGAYALVLMDCQMPEMDGYETTRRIRATGVSVPIVAMTASAHQEARNMCLACGMNDYLTKPVDKRRLAGVLDRWT
jgi:two-component system, sensor histidine kinase